ncbi:MAG: DUF3696 domain-containing protein [Magnetococcales bacterium]|nr:DUF3696 domain-containing protein [Magnetococcales bacterium]MBF0115188.1 DUF3696 domain-containing protein [Magnetococcales bacterium]
MLKHLRIRNFKGWKDTGDIVMAPITLFFGTNSSGKSSIGQFLMMLKQTAESSDRRAVFFPGDENSAVQLGSFQQMVFSRDVSNKIFFQYKWDCTNKIEFSDPISQSSYSGKFMVFESEVSLSSKNQTNLIVEQIKYELLNDSDQHILSISMDRKNDKYKVKSDTYKLTRKLGRAWPLGSPLRFYGFPDEVVAYHQNADFVKDLNFRQEILFRSIFYLGPLRTKTARLYSWNGIEPDSVGYAGQNTVAALLSAQDRKIGIKKGNNNKASPSQLFEAVIARSLQNMGLINDFKVDRLHEQRDEYEVKVQVGHSNTWVDLPDVGFGISQVLPVLVECYYAPAGSIIIMEQPEIHLHPSAQSALADVLIDVVQSRENGKDRKIQLIIETHSEHFLRRLQRRIAEGVIPLEHVSAYSASVTDSSSQLTPLDIDAYGNIRNWPPNFFGNEMEDITRQADAAMERRKTERSMARGDA